MSCWPWVGVVGLGGGGTKTLVRHHGVAVPAVLAERVDCPRRHTDGPQVLRDGVPTEQWVGCSLPPKYDIVT